MDVKRGELLLSEIMNGGNFGRHYTKYGEFTTLSNVNKEKKSDKVGIVSELLNYLANRSLKNSSAIEYDINLVSRYKRNRNDFQNDRYNYFLFRLNYYQHYDIDDLSVTLIMESLNSAIDRYNLLLYVLRSYLIKEPEHMASVLHFARKLYRMSGDSLLYPFLAINNVQKMPEDYYSEEFIRILDYYYTGKYEETITACRNFLLKDPSNFDVVKLYSRALLFLHRGFRNIDGNKDCILNEIAFNVYRVMTEKDNDQYKDTLYKLNKHIYGFQIAAGLDYFIREERNTSRCETLRQLSMTCFDPYFNGIFQDDDIRQEYIEAALQRMPHSKALNYQHQRILKEVIEDTSIVSYIRDVDNAKILFENGKYEEALEKWKVILDDNHDITPTAQTAVEYIFRSYMKLGVEYRQQAVRFYIDKYIDNKAFVSKIDTHQFLADIKKVAMSSDDEKVSVTYIGDGSEESKTNNFDIEVQRLATPQINQGRFLKDNTLSMRPGAYSFDLNTPGAAYEFQYNINSDETNLDVLVTGYDIIFFWVARMIFSGCEHTGKTPFHTEQSKCTLFHKKSSQKIISPVISI